MPDGPHALLKQVQVGLILALTLGEVGRLERTGWNRNPVVRESQPNGATRLIGKAARATARNFLADSGIGLTYRWRF